MPRAHLVTQAYGTDAIRAQALYLAYSSLAWRDDAALDVHVYTDAPERFAPLAGAVEVRAMGPEDISRWRGPQDFTHRLKALLVQDVTRRFPGDPLLYLDADTLWQQPVGGVLSRIGPGRAVMHEREQHLADPGDPHLRHFRRRLKQRGGTFAGQPIDLDRWMWNAGAIGLHPSAFPVVDQWIAFIDTVWPRYRRGLVEQYGIAMLLQRAGEVVACSDAVLHYWPQKDEYTAAVIREAEALVRLPLPDALDHVRAHPIQIPYRPPRPFRLSPWKKLRRSLFGEH